MVEAPPKPKIPGVRVNSDTCAVYVGRELVDGEITEEGTPYYVHEGEWVEVLHVRSVMERNFINQIRDRVVDVADPDTETPEIGTMDRIMVELCLKLSERVVAWDWTNMAGKPLPAPYLNPDALMELGNEELFWLLNCLDRDTPEVRKNGSGGSEVTS